MNDSSLRLYSAKLLAYVVCDLFPHAQLVESKENSFGFYCDFLTTPPLNEDFLKLIEERFGQICLHLPESQLMHMMRENTVEFFLHHQQPLLAEQAAQVEENVIDLIKIDNFYDLYPSSMIPDISKITSFKLLSLTRKTNYYPALGKLEVCRIQGVVFEERHELKKFLKSWAAYQKNQHQKLGPEMDFFIASRQSVLLLPRGEWTCDYLMDWCRHGYRALGYQKISTLGLTPALHTQHSSHSTIEWEEDLYQLPSSQTSIPVFDLGECRYFEEKSLFNPIGLDSLDGLLNSQTFRATYAYLFCKMPQLLDEVISCLQFIARTVKVFDFEHQWILYPKAEKNVASKERRLKAIEFLQKALELCGLDYQIDEASSTRLGPAIEAKLIDSLGRQWSGPQLEFDFYASKSLKAEPLWAVRWTALGSIERALALLIEQNEGSFPFWLAPEQVRILPIGEGVAEYAREIRGLMINQNLRVAIDESQQTLGEKIYSATRQRIPYLVILGNKEKRENRMTVRPFGNHTGKTGVKIESFLQQLQEENKSPKENGH